MIAIPLQENHDLLLELESVQRALLYHCPLLINACVASVLTRMPLLYIDARRSKGGAGKEEEEEKENEWSGAQDFFQATKQKQHQAMTMGWRGREGDVLTSRDPVTQTLFSIVEAVVQELLYTPLTERQLDNEDKKNHGDTTNDKDHDNKETSLQRDGVNAQQIQPLLIPFQGLELENGNRQDNEILYAIGQEDCEGTHTLRRVLEEITLRIQDQGWKVYLPLDQPQGGFTEKNGGGAGKWRPRIPFVRLPTNFVESLPDPKGWDGNWADYSQEERESYVRLPEEGGNGISPIFWFNFAEDEFCDGNAVRYVSIRKRENVCVCVCERERERWILLNTFIGREKDSLLVVLF